MSARRLNTVCPDCNRWRCVCGDGCADCGEHANPCACIRRETAEAYYEALPAPARAPVRTGPPPAPIRERLAKLRAEIAQHLASVRRTPA